MVARLSGLSAIFRHSLAPAVAGAGPRFCYQAAQEVSRLGASPFMCRRKNGRRFRLLPGASTREPPRFLLCAACARQQAGQLVKGAHEAAFGYRLRSRSVTITF